MVSKDKKGRKKEGRGRGEGKREQEDELLLKREAPHAASTQQVGPADRLPLTGPLVKGGSKCTIHFLSLPARQSQHRKSAPCSLTCTRGCSQRPLHPCGQGRWLPQAAHLLKASPSHAPSLQERAQHPGLKSAFRPHWDLVSSPHFFFLETQVKDESDTEPELRSQDQKSTDV